MSTSTTTPLIIGIDPGVTGAIAFLKPKEIEPSVYNLPVTERTYLSNQSKRLDTISFYCTLLAETELIANIYTPCKQTGVLLVMEQMQSLGHLTPPKVLTMLAEMAGTLEAAIRVWCWEKGFPFFMRKVQPKTWVHWMFPNSGSRTGRKSEAKEESLQAARQLFPSLGTELSRKKDNDRAEALLLAFVGAAELSGCRIDPALKTFGDVASLYNCFSQNTKQSRAVFSKIYNDDAKSSRRWSPEICKEIELRRKNAETILDAPAQRIYSK